MKKLFALAVFTALVVGCQDKVIVPAAPQVGPAQPSAPIIINNQHSRPPQVCPPAPPVPQRPSINIQIDSHQRPAQTCPPAPKR